MLFVLLTSTQWCSINIFRHFVPSVSLGATECACWAWLWTRMVTIYFSTCIVIISPFHATITSLSSLTQRSWTLSQKIEFLVFFQQLHLWTRLLLKKPSSSLLPNLLLVAPVQVWSRYLVPPKTPLSLESSKQQLNYLTIRQMGFGTN